MRLCSTRGLPLIPPGFHATFTIFSQRRPASHDSEHGSEGRNPLCCSMLSNLNMEFGGPEVQVPETSDLLPYSSPTLEVKRSPDVWFEDGTIILEAESIQFKVFKGILAANSTVFSDMLVVGSIPENTDLVEGCPVVHVFDSALDMKH